MATVDGKSRYPAGQQRKWLHVDADGVLTCVAADKHTLVCTLGIPLRDLRILDPLVCSSVEVRWTYRKASILCMCPNSRMLDKHNHALQIAFHHAGGKLLPNMHLCQRKGPARQPGALAHDHQQGPVHHFVSAPEPAAAPSPVRAACITRSSLREGACEPTQAGCRQVCFGLCSHHGCMGGPCN